uniref:Uncharacterized protein n=1 Tax=Macaca fascicularis TaxID=9541 RepID=Q9GMK5_MACFA|nr:hypothetical protein [Macaca fascicularis]
MLLWNDIYKGDFNACTRFGPRKNCYTMALLISAATEGRIFYIFVWRSDFFFPSFRTGLAPQCHTLAYLLFARPSNGILWVQPMNSIL